MKSHTSSKGKPRSDLIPVPKNRWFVGLLAVALMFVASMPQGYMLARGADNVVEIVVCRGFGHESQSLFLDIESGEYLESGDLASAPGDAQVQNNPCEFTLAGFDGLYDWQYSAETSVLINDIPVVLRRWDIVSSSFQYPSPRGPPIIV